MRHIQRDQANIREEVLIDNRTMKESRQKEGQRDQKHFLLFFFLMNIKIKRFKLPDLRVTASEDRAKLEIDPKIKTLKLCQNKAYHKPD